MKKSIHPSVSIVHFHSVLIYRHILTLMKATFINLGTSLVISRQHFSPNMNHFRANTDGVISAGKGTSNESN